MMVVKFEKYWEEYSVVPALGAVLNPRIKLSLLEYCYSKVDASTSESKLEKVKKKKKTSYTTYLSIILQEAKY